MNLHLNPDWDPGVAVVDLADLPELLPPKELREYLELRELQIKLADQAITLNGEAATVEALRRRGVLIEGSVP